MQNGKRNIFGVWTADGNATAAALEQTLWGFEKIIKSMK